MRATLHVAAREVFSFFVTPAAWVTLTLWMVLEGFHFYLLASYFATTSFQMPSATDTPLTFFFTGILFFVPIVVVVPLLTMRLLAEERRTGTLETLMTAPVSEGEVVTGKYLAGVVFWVALWAPTALYLPLLNAYGDLDWGALGAAYFGVFLLGVAFVAVGLLMSAVGQSQIVAGAATFAALVLLLFVGLGEYVFEGEAAEAFGYVNVMGFMEDFAKGVVDTRRVVFALSLAVLGWFLAVRALEARRYEA